MNVEEFGGSPNAGDRKLVMSHAPTAVVLCVKPGSVALTPPDAFKARFAEMYVTTSACSAPAAHDDTAAAMINRETNM
jgi:hypothetical protein